MISWESFRSEEKEAKNLKIESSCWFSKREKFLRKEKLEFYIASQRESKRIYESENRVELWCKCKSIDLLIKPFS